MPGELRPDATCPVCGEPLDALVDTTTASYVSRKYYHGKTHPKRRRKLPCKFKFYHLVAARQERRFLEMPPCLN